MKITANWGRWALALFPMMLAFIVIIFGLFSSPEFVEEYVNSDSLLPAHMAWDVAHHSHALAAFQWPRIPSLPDIAFFFLAEFAGLGWRSAMMLYACLVAGALILIGGWVLARLRPIHYSNAVFWSGLVVVAVLQMSVFAIGAFAKDHDVWFPHLLVLIPATHGDALLLSMLASCTALMPRDGRKWPISLTLAVCGLGAFSDLLFVGYFLIPFFASSLVVFLVGRCVPSRGAATPASGGRDANPARDMIKLAGLCSLACAAGWLLQLGLPRQGFESMIYPGISEAFHKIFTGLPAVPSVAASLAVSLAAVLPAVAILRNQPDHAFGPSEWDDRSRMHLNGLAAIALSFGLLFLIYEDVRSYRYAMPLLWWPLFLVVGSIRLPGSNSSKSVAAIGAALVSLALPLAPPILPHWRSPLEQCLTSNRTRFGLKAGLAPFWNSRLTMASSDWTFQVDQIDENGDFYVWGNDRDAFLHDMTAQAGPPVYNFIVVDDTISGFVLDTVYGLPSRQTSCGAAEIWIYDQPIVPAGTAPRDPAA